ncbi:PD-(D/E)XK nuclease family protein [Hymenobacter sp. H14-R3]|uniref:PDDEXK-like family protein n=1 Tax=Hymenobacter sp. H14-R3 TaxID=3046308 RepID=UPI0024BB77FC|nr:PD-(D/E)XK nuclease family protein [Hymenobacter sp. H14-R3]MDJ0368073.1 PD-(D/E)XK nuclease family protein [Hymenobacter sp. H14-R3]
MVDTLTPFRSLLQRTQELVVQHEDQVRTLYLEEAPGFSPFHFIKWGEVPVTHLLAYFLDAQQSHGQQDAFQRNFVTAVQAHLPYPRLSQGLYKVVAEKRHGGGDYGQIDLLLTCTQPRFALCIENKPHASTVDQDRQLEAYHEFLTGIGGFGDDYLLIYLSGRTRAPHASSLDPVKRMALQQTGHYLNLTYETFLLPLLSEWAEVAKPEKVRLFLLDFRYQVERQLNFPSTSPTATMYQEEIADLLLQDVTLLQAAYELPNALKAAEKRLGVRLGQELRDVAEGLQLQPAYSEDDWQDFIGLTNETTCSFTKSTWGSFCIGLEFSGPTLDVGVVGGGRKSALGQALSKLLGDTQGNDGWACWEPLYNTDYKTLFTSIATGSFKDKLRARLTALCQALDVLHQQGLLTGT